ncbi:MAG: hypothetical protein J6568_08555 [Snodgrassella sp.]|nr:hypothetical protein [Snodgrassella sp.]
MSYYNKVFLLGIPVGNNNDMGSVQVFHTNGFKGDRLKNSRWKGDLPEAEVTKVFDMIKTLLNWDFEDTKNSKILLLTNNIISIYGSYSQLSQCFKHSQRLLTRENKFIEFFSTVLEPICHAYENKRYGEMFNIQTDFLLAFIENDKTIKRLNQNLKKLLDARKRNIVDVIDTLLQQQIPFPKLPDELKQIHEDVIFQKNLNEEELTTGQVEYKKMCQVRYQEVVNALNYIDNLTPFNTQHGVKGEEYDNVLIALCRGWNQYN